MGGFASLPQARGQTPEVKNEKLEILRCASNEAYQTRTIFSMNALHNNILASIFQKKGSGWTWWMVYLSSKALTPAS
jgi:hypothetical protein